MSDVSFSGFLTNLQYRLECVQDSIPPLPELVAEIAATTTGNDSVGLSRDGRTVRWMRSVQNVFIQLGAVPVAILGVLPGYFAGTFAVAYTAGPLSSMASSPRTEDAFYRAFRGTVEYCAVFGGAVGAVVGSIIVSVVVPPISGAVNLIDNLRQRYHG
ncbi:hypothetical protein [Pseudochelatococcus sp. G4_1912]|uniref:hypothetical protein n=1 Tax=Pseudochelatococcus sp. G4_1912 TaxID=3114288 RepID=UPI0039C6DAD6